MCVVYTEKYTEGYTENTQKDTQKIHRKTVELDILPVVSLLPLYYLSLILLLLSPPVCPVRYPAYYLH